MATLLVRFWFSMANPGCPDIFSVHSTQLEQQRTPLEASGTSRGRLTICCFAADLGRASPKTAHGPFESAISRAMSA